MAEGTRRVAQGISITFAVLVLIAAVMAMVSGEQRGWPFFVFVLGIVLQGIAHAVGPRHPPYYKALLGVSITLLILSLGAWFLGHRL